MPNKRPFTTSEAIGLAGIGILLLVLAWHCMTYYADVFGAITY